MGRPCSICGHAERDAIEDAFVAGVAKRRIAAQYGVSEQSVRRHVREHLPALLALARDAERTARADTVLDRLEALQERTAAILDALEGTGQYHAQLAAIRELRRNLKLIAEVRREIERSAQINLELNDAWRELRARIVEALGPFPEARASGIRAISGVRAPRELEAAANGRYN